MLNKAKIYFAVMTAVTALAVPASLLSADAPAGASTTACGGSCTSPTVQSVGTGQALAVSGTSSVTMSTANTTSSTEDWTPEQEGAVANAVAAGVLAPRLNMLYSTDQLVEFQYAPNGVPSDQCLSNTSSVPIGTGAPPFNVPTLTVVLAQCGITAASLWIVDASNEANGYVDLINAGYESQFSYATPTSSNANFENPFAEPAVLTVNSSGHVVLAFLSELGGVVSPTQMWAAWSAPGQLALRAAVQAEHRKSVNKPG